MRSKDSHRDGRISRVQLVSLVLGIAIMVIVAAVVVFGAAGCKEQNALGGQNVNIPMPQVSNFVADSRTKIYHKITCKVKPTKGTLVYFDSPVGAQQVGYHPCRVCKPNEP